MKCSSANKSLTSCTPLVTHGMRPSLPCNLSIPGMANNGILANEQVLLNLNCKIINLSKCLKEKSKCRSDASIDLLDENGILANLSEMEHSPEYASNYLHERGRYVLVKIIRGEGQEPTRYESLLDNLGRRHPELAERLQKLSNPQLKEKSPVHRKPRPPKELPVASPTKPKSIAHSKRSSSLSNRST
ncbi:uncharacterized protein C22orf15 homolog isoform X1 [Pleurodeles waltl]|uniref:uncharacterized protein C22orf15 homolog isoform X1 n=1 Tax=Pleurodeles waltl TaxID=8319 RepID=UPI00370983C9